MTETENWPKGGGWGTTLNSNYLPTRFHFCCSSMTTEDSPTPSAKAIDSEAHMSSSNPVINHFAQPWTCRFFPSPAQPRPLAFHSFEEEQTQMGEAAQKVMLWLSCTANEGLDDTIIVALLSTYSFVRRRYNGDPRSFVESIRSRHCTDACVRRGSIRRQILTLAGVLSRCLPNTDWCLGMVYGYL